MTRDGRTQVYTAGTGDLTTGKPPRPDDRLRVAGVSKAYSGAVALRLVDRVLPARHTSGLADYSADPRHRFDSRRLLDFVAGEPLRFAPGSLYAYANSDNIAVALMAEAVTGRRYDALLAELV
ncbi:serine hydrolase [Streptomyces globosus]|uniref:serine hydrolase n=1 Tax=Streptomyces globosus TaxID=68209 RepID=UPI00380F52A3